MLFPVCPVFCTRSPSSGALEIKLFSFYAKDKPYPRSHRALSSCSKDGSAWRDGQIKVGDEVVAVDSKSVIGWSHDDLVNAIAGRGPPCPLSSVLNTCVI
jgi:hypothetical protein